MISYARLGDLVDSVTGTKVRRELWTAEAMKEALKKDPEKAIKTYRPVFAGGKGVAWPMEQTFNFRRGIRTEDMRSWVEKNLGLRRW